MVPKTWSICLPHVYWWKKQQVYFGHFMPLVAYNIFCRAIFGHGIKWSKVAIGIYLPSLLSIVCWVFICQPCWEYTAIPSSLRNPLTWGNPPWQSTPSVFSCCQVMVMQKKNPINNLAHWHAFLLQGDILATLDRLQFESKRAIPFAARPRDPPYHRGFDD